MIMSLHKKAASCVWMLLVASTVISGCRFTEECDDGPFDLEEAARFCCTGVEVPATPRTQETELGDGLLVSIASNDVKMVQFFLLIGADANYKDDFGVTPLGKAICDTDNGPNPQIVEVLLKRGADPRALWGNCGTTPFFYLVQNSTSFKSGSAVLSNQVAAVRLMLKHGADPNRKQGLFRRSSLEYAAMRNGDIELIKALVDGGAVITDKAIEDAEDADIRQYLVKAKETQQRQVAGGIGKERDGAARESNEIRPAVSMPLLTKMLNAYDAWEAVRWDLSNTNSLEDATRQRIAAIKYMRYCDEGMDGEVQRKSWPFDVDAFESGLAQKMVCDKYGLYCVKGKYNDYDEGILEDGNVAVKPSIRWMNRKTEEWATNALDGVYRRLAKDELDRMLDAKSVNAGTFCWAIGTNEYFIIQSVDDDHGFESRNYIYMCWDGKSEPRIGATFNSMPNSKTMFAVRSCLAGNPVGRNNMAALMWNKVIGRGDADERIIKRLLEAAEDTGVAVATENLEILGE